MKAIAENKVLNAIVRLAFLALQCVARTFFYFRYRKPGKSMPPIDDPLLLDSATTLARKIRKKEVTSVQVVKAFIKRMQQVNPTFNAIVDLRFASALQDARKIDELISKGTKTEKELEEETPFLGVPFTFKSCISSKGMRYTAGLISRRNCVGMDDAEVLTLMKEAGAIPLASTNLSEMGVWWESYNPVHGWTCNPYDSNRTVGGSSGGEGCVQAFAGSPMGLGSDLGGSIRIPSHFNGIFGHKPTNGCSPNKGHLPLPQCPENRHFLVIGPMSRFAGDLLPMFKIITRNCLTDLKLNEKPNLKNLRYFYMDHDGESPVTIRVHPEVKAALHRVVKYLEETLGVKVERVNLKRMKLAALYWFARLKGREGPVLAKALANSRGSKNLYWEVLKFFLGSREHTFPVLVAAILEGSMTYGDPQHSFYIRELEELKKDFERLLRTDGVFLCPTFPTAAPCHWEGFSRPFDFSFTAPFNCLGFPVTHCPLGLNSKGLPIGVQVVAPEYHDRYSLAVAEELERGFGGWVSPPIQSPKLSNGESH